MNPKRRQFSFLKGKHFINGYKVTMYDQSAHQLLYSYRQGGT